MRRGDFVANMYLQQRDDPLIYRAATSSPIRALSVSGVVEMEARGRVKEVIPSKDRHHGWYGTCC